MLCLTHGSLLGWDTVLSTPSADSSRIVSFQRPWSYRRLPRVLSCHVKPDVRWRQVDVRPQVTWRTWRSYWKYNSLKICLILFKFCTPSSSQAPWKQGMSHTPLSSIFLSPNFIWRKNLTRRGKWYVIRVYKKMTYRNFTQLQLINWPIKNPSGNRQW